MSRTATLDRPRKAAPENGQHIAEAVSKDEKVQITPPNMRTIKLRIVGTAPYLQCAFPEKAKQQIMAKQQGGDAAIAGKRPRRAPRDYDADFKGALHQFPDGKFGIPAAGFRAAAISACRLVGFKMTMAKLSIFILPDGFDSKESVPLVRIEGSPEKHVMMGRNDNGVPDVRVRGIYKEWAATLTIRFDADQFCTADVVNLFSRVGEQIGIGEGRPDSKNSAGMGLGTFRIEA